MRVIVLTSFLLVMVSCAKEEHQLIMSSPIVSLAKSRAPKNELTTDQYVQIRWCQGEKSHLGNGERRRTLIEEVLAKAHAETGSEYFLNANFYQDAVRSIDWAATGWNPCITLRGHTAKASVQ
jgi:hypothetical protein